MQRCIVTGISGGIGRAIGDELLDSGFFVTGISRRKPENWRGNFLQADLRDEQELNIIRQQLTQQKMDLWGLINVAGQGIADDVESLSPGALKEMLMLNAVAPAALVGAVVPLMRSGGRIISISSIVAAGKAHRSSYSASKAALNALSSCWARELGPRSITANIIAPGPVDTPMLRSVVQRDSQEERDLLSKIPTQRFTSPKEIANLVIYLLSDFAKNLNGQVINVDGGLYGGAP
jgi:3-oxoacyl-[acyl-carrier protein] reductase